jgi:hypothetical protein
MKHVTCFCVIALGSVFFADSFADDCLAYKLKPTVDISVPEWQKNVVQPLKPMDLWHGNVVATMLQNYEIVGDTTSIEDGFCVALKSVHATVGYSEFQVQIDSRHARNSCAYNAILGHEDEHIRAYMSVIDDNKSNIEKSVYAAANAVLPVFVKNESEIDGALDILNAELQKNPDLILMNQKIDAEQEIRNKKVDQNESGEHLRKCLDN